MSVVLWGTKSVGNWNNWNYFEFGLNYTCFFSSRNEVLQEKIISGNYTFRLSLATFYWKRLKETFRFWLKLIFCLNKKPIVFRFYSFLFFSSNWSKYFADFIWQPKLIFHTGQFQPSCCLPPFFFVSISTSLGWFKSLISVRDKPLSGSKKFYCHVPDLFQLNEEVSLSCFLFGWIHCFRALIQLCCML